jgi:uncharacterized RDD family membrane protein YckC
MEYEDRVQIATPEGVDVELTLAGIGSRFIAAILDFLVQGGFLLAVGIVLGVVNGFGADDGETDYVAAAVFTIAFFLTFFFYDVLFEVRSRGRTLGKRWTGLRVVRTGGRPVNLVTSVVRNVLRLVDILPSFYALGMLSIFVTRRNQRLGDIAAGTLVIRDRPGGVRGAPATPLSTATVGTGAADGWDVSGVSAQDIATVRRFLERRGDLAADARRNLAADLERRLRPRVAGAPERLGPEEFLERLSAAKAGRS